MPQKSPHQLVLLTKPAIPGRVKTRLIGDLSAAQTAELHRVFLADVVGRLRHGNFGLEVAWALEPGEAIPDLADVIGQGAKAKGVRQEGADLGERLFAGLAQAGGGDAACVAAVGSDHPELEAATVESAFAKLEAGAGVVLGPVSDGGYYLLAVRRSQLVPALFEGIDWSTERVLAQTVAQARRLGLEVELLPEGHDVDVPADLDALARRLAHRPQFCPRTMELLRALSLVEKP